MGADAMFIVQTKKNISLERVRWELIDAFDDKYITVERASHNPDHTIIESLGRYYGPGYERGDWPALRAKILWLRARFGEEVMYTSDAAYDPDSPLFPTTDEEIAEIDAHFNEHGHTPYRLYSKKEHCGGPMAIEWTQRNSRQIGCIVCDHKKTEANR